MTRDGDAFPLPMSIGMQAAALVICAVLIGACARGPGATPLSATPASRVIDFETREGTRLAFDISPDGRELVIDLLGQLWIVDANGGQARAITNSVRDASVALDPAWSPDGAWVAFQEEGRSMPALWLVRRDGTDMRVLTDSATPAASAAWSPDGKSIAYVSRDSIRVLEVASATLRTLRIDSLPPGAVRTPAWSPDGMRIAFAHGSGKIMEVSRDGGRPRVISPPSLRASAPAYAPDGRRIAFFVDSAGNRQIHIQAIGDTSSQPVISGHRDLTNLRVRWTRGGDALLYSADGRLWRRRLATSNAAEIPFRARVSFTRYEPPMRAIAFAEPGAELRARGFLGLALSPDGEQAAMIALGTLWLIASSDGTARALASMPFTANGLAWSPDGRQLVWGAGAGGAEDLYITDARTGATRPFTALAGRESRPSWSPDGQWIAFVHWPKAMCDTPPSQYDDECGLLRIRAAPVGDTAIRSLENTRLLATGGIDWVFSFFGAGQEVPHWTPQSNGVLFALGERVMFAPLDAGAPPREMRRVPAGATFVQPLADSSTLFVRGNQLWRTTGSTATASLLSTDAALYPIVARDGRILYVSHDGLRLRATDGTSRALGWPIRFRVPERDGALLVRGAWVFDGTGVAARTRDLLIRNGRFSQIADSGTIRADPGTRVIAAEGRTVLPGLIDLHGHLWDDAILPASLTNGVTTMRDMGSAVARVSAMRDALAAGVFAGPRLVIGGFQFNPGSNGVSGVVLQGPADTASGARGLALLAAFGGEYAKMRLAWNQVLGGAFVRAARARGMRISGHCAHTLPFIAAGINAKEHLSAACSDRSDGIWYEDLTRLFAAAAMPVVVTTAGFASVPRVQRDTNLVRGASAPFATPYLRWWALRLPPTSAATYERLARTSRAAAAALRGKVTVIPASDDPTFADAIHWELEEMVSAGWTPAEAIAAATRDAARALGAERDIGTIEIGKLADLLIIDGDPLTDIRNTRRIVDVIQGGVIVDRAMLRRWAAVP